ncbi:dihydroneopterin aldolase [Maricaulis sp.]|jgi:7,8-dihydroneopterin aldolase/epimerase/oxygenase|uniref:dihydroneopterin aldolase n=1 Tax=Maricaulis sp. TaxID=1486257 RepID=UPI0026008BC1|nr:dihydroneopterin aldolase [Maricaulis sp.]MDF1769158.1 dihydroneopterin aldolase [Maricaulis sp.]
MRLDQVIENALANASGEDVFVYRLEGVKMDVEIGIHDYERGVKQRVLIDVVTLVNKAWCGSDDIATVVDYDYILHGIKALEARQFDLQETLCGVVLDLALEPATVAAAQVTTRKVDAYADAEAVGLTRFRRKV